MRTGDQATGELNIKCPVCNEKISINYISSYFDLPECDDCYCEHCEYTQNIILYKDKVLSYSFIIEGDRISSCIIRKNSFLENLFTGKTSNTINTFLPLNAEIDLLPQINKNIAKFKKILNFT